MATSQTKGLVVNYVLSALVITTLVVYYHFQKINISEVSPPTLATFSDVPATHPFFIQINNIYQAGVASGCTSSPLNFCPEDSLTRAQAAVVLLRAKHGASYTPPAATSSFSDVPSDHWAKNWIEALKSQGISGGCTATTFCPDSPVTRAQFAVLLLKTKHGSSYTPTSTTTTFSDTISHWARFWIEDLKTQGITTGCGGTNFCPENSVSRGEMAVFLVNAFPTLFVASSPSPSLSPSPLPSPSVFTGFNDISTNDTFYNAIMQLSNGNIATGCDTNLYCPNDNFTRAQAAVVLLRIKYGTGYAPPASVSSFTDVPDNHWAKNWIEKVKADGISGGCGGAKFCPEQGITRAEFVIMILKVKYGAGYQAPVATSTFTDSVGHWATNWIEAAKNDGISYGCSSTTFCPDQVVSRAMMAGLIVNSFPTLTVTTTPTPTPSPNNHPNTYDVLVVGGGASGISAALQAARQGARVAIIEETDWLGGQMSAAAVSTMDEGLGYWQREGGIFKELYQKTEDYYDTEGLTMSTCYLWDESFCPEPKIVQKALQELLSETRARGRVLDVFAEQAVTQLLRNNAKVTGVITASGRQFDARVVIDATEYGDLLPLTGVNFRVGNALRTDLTTTSQQENTCIQNITYSGVVKKYPNLPSDLRITTRSAFYHDYLDEFRSQVALKGSPFFDYIHYPVDWNAHNAYRGLPDPDGDHNYYSTQYQQGVITKTGLNFTNDYPTNARFLLDKEYRQARSCLAKTKTIDFIGYTQTELLEPDWGADTSQQYSGSYNQSHACPSFPTSWQATEQALPVIPYVRESMRIIGSQTLGFKDIPESTGGPATSERYTSARFDTAIAVADYGLDVHGCQSTANLEVNLDGPDMPFGKARIFQIPIETLIPKNLDGFLAAEKNISQSRVVNGATRVQPTMMAVGQAAGSLAAHAVRLGVEPRNINPVLVQESLAQTRQRLSVEYIANIPTSYWAFPHLQLALAHNSTINPTIIPAEGRILARHTIDPDEPITRGEAALTIVSAKKIPLETPQQPTFVDTESSHPFYHYIETLYAAGITSGCNPTPHQFCPDRAITRAEYAVLMSRALRLNINSYPNISSSFTDLDSDASWAAGHIEAAYRAGVLTGCSQSPLRFCPNDPVTRAQSWVFSSRLLLKSQPPTITTNPLVVDFITVPPISPTNSPNPPSILPGDLNHSGGVDLNDFKIFLKGYGELYDLADLKHIINNFVKTTQQ